MGNTRKLKHLLECYPDYFRKQGRLEGATRRFMMFLHRNPIVLLLVILTDANGWVAKTINIFGEAINCVIKIADKYHWFVRVHMKVFTTLVVCVTFVLFAFYKLFATSILILTGEIEHVIGAPGFWFPYWQYKFLPYWCGNTAVQSIAIFGLHDCLKVAIDAGLPRSVNEEVFLAVHQTYMPKQVIKLLIKDQPEFDPNWRPNSWWDYLTSKSILEVVTERGKADLIAVIKGKDDDDDAGAGEVANILDEKVESVCDEVEDSEVNTADGGDSEVSRV